MESEIHKKLLEQQSKYTYYLLSIVAACLALTLKRTEDLVFHKDMIILAIAVISWGSSFIFGCYNRKYNTSNLYANLALLIAEKGKHEGIGSDPVLIQAASKGIKAAFDSNANKQNRFAQWQWKTLIFGAGAYIVWHILQMIKITNM